MRAPGSAAHAETARIVRGHGLTTVCEEAGCPNIGECWAKRHATFMIMGDTCTRACAFCNVRTGMPRPLDPHEPERVAAAAKELGLTHIVITSVDRDDLADGGVARISPRVITALRAAAPATTIEVLTPDFLRKDGALETVLAARPTCSTTTSKPCRGSTCRSAPARATSIRCACCSAPRRSTARFSPSPASWSASARRAKR